MIPLYELKSIYSKRRLDINVDGIKFQIILEYKYFYTYLKLKLIRSSLPKNVLTIAVGVNVTANIWSDWRQPKKKEILYDVYQDTDEQDIVSMRDDHDAKDRIDEIELEFGIEISKIKYFYMNIHSNMKWNLNLNELKKMNESVERIAHKIRGWSVEIFIDDTNGKRKLRVNPDTFPLNIIQLTIEYNVVINGRESSSKNDINIRMNGTKNISKYGYNLCDLTKDVCFDSYCVTLDMKITKIICRGCVGVYLEEAIWSKYGFV